MLLECCVDSLAAAHAAALGGADRIELCAQLDIGGTTPDMATLRAALAQLAVPVFPMVRPRGGDFVFNVDDITTILDDVHRVRGAGATGAVIGALTLDGDIDGAAMARCRDAAGTMQLTFHRAFDAARDPSAALDTLIDLGVDRVLTSGQGATAWEGRALLRQLVDKAGNRIVIMAGGTVTPENAAALVATTGVTELHFRTTDEQKVRQVRARVEDQSSAV